MAIVCNICGKQSPVGTNFCEDCGADLRQQPVNNAPIQPVQPAQPEVPPAPGWQQSPAWQPNPQVPPQVAPQVVPQVAPQVANQPVPDMAAAAQQVAETPALAPSDSGLRTVNLNQAGTQPLVLPQVQRTGKLVLKQYGTLTSQEIPLVAERLVFGRFDASSGPVDIDLTGLPGVEHISRRHAEFFLEGGSWKVRDLGSSNGIYLKRKGEAAFSPRLLDVAELHDGDEVALGNMQFLFQEG